MPFRSSHVYDDAGLVASCKRRRQRRKLASGPVWGRLGQKAAFDTVSDPSKALEVRAVLAPVLSLRPFKVVVDRLPFLV
jgi:hypothetical protein